MQFLVIEKVATQTGLPNELFEQVPGILGAIREYQAELTKRGKLKGAWALDDVPGGAFILDVSSGEELNEILTASPSVAFPLTREVHPVSGSDKQLESTARVVSAGIAQRHAMMANRPT